MSFLTTSLCGVLHERFAVDPVTCCGIKFAEVEHNCVEGTIGTELCEILLLEVTIFLAWLKELARSEVGV